MLSLFNGPPQVWALRDRLYLRAPRGLRALSLGSYDRKITIDRARSEIEIVSRWFWTCRTVRTISFARVAHVDVEYNSLDLGGGGDSIDLMERFRVYLILRAPYERITLAVFSAGGEPTLPIPGLGGLGMDANGEVESSAKAFVHRIAEWIGVTVGPPAHHYADASGTKYYCRECERPSAPGRATCLYCGGELDAVIAAATARATASSKR